MSWTYKGQLVIEIPEGLDHIRKAFARRRSGVHGLDPVVVGFGQECIGRVHGCVGLPASSAAPMSEYLGRAFCSAGLGEQEERRSVRKSSLMRR